MKSKTIYYPALAMLALVSLEVNPTQAGDTPRSRGAEDCETLLGAAIKKVRNQSHHHDFHPVGNPYPDPPPSDIFPDYRAIIEESKTRYPSLAYHLSKKFFQSTTSLKRRLGKIWAFSLKHGWKHRTKRFADIFRVLFLKQKPDLYYANQDYLRQLHEKGNSRVSYGHDVIPGMIRPMSKTKPRDPETIATIRNYQEAIGRDHILPDQTVIPLKRRAIVSPMAGLNYSAVSFPQATAEAHLVNLYVHIKLAKDGIRTTLNSGEGGPQLLLAYLSGDLQALKDEILAKGIQSGEISRNSPDHARIDARAEFLMNYRNELFKEFTEEDLGLAQIVVQIGSAMNSARLSDDFWVDLDKLALFAQHPNVVMIQFKHQQAAKRGSRVENKKLTPAAKAFRDTFDLEGQAFKSPAINPEFESYQATAELILATKMVTRLPVSIKLAIGDVFDFNNRIAYWQRTHALPDHIQVDGGSEHFSPGSGNFNWNTNTSLNADQATIVANAILKRHGVRDQVYLEASGEIQHGSQLMVLQALGADAGQAARTWMTLNLGCNMVQDCSKHNGCPYGITAKENSVFALGLDPRVKGPMGYAAAREWSEQFSIAMAEAGALPQDETDKKFRDTHGLHRFGRNSQRIRVQGYEDLVTLREIYQATDIATLLNTQLVANPKKSKEKYLFSREEVIKHVYGEFPPYDFPSLRNYPEDF